MEVVPAGAAFPLLAALVVLLPFSPSGVLTGRFSSEPGSSGSRSLTISREVEGSLKLKLGGGDRCTLHGEAGRLRLETAEGQYDLGLLAELREIQANVSLRLTGSLESSRALGITAPQLRIGGSVRAPALRLNAQGLLEIEPSGSVTLVPGGRLDLEADFVSLVGPVHAPSGTLYVQARGVLHQGEVLLDAAPGSEAGRASIACDRYLGS